MRSYSKRSYGYIYFAVLLLSLHYAFTLYINSTYLNLFFTERTINFLYMIGSIGTLLCLILSSSIIRTIGAFRCLVGGLIAEAIVLFSLSFSTSPSVVGGLFIVHQMVPPLLLYLLDIFLEAEIPSETETGRVRSNYLTISNLAFVLSPLVVGNIVMFGSYKLIYLCSGIFVSFLLILVLEHFKHHQHKSFREVNFFDSLHKFPYRKGLGLLFSTDFLLQCFYALMVIYTPIYLHTVVGFDWPAIGSLFTIMLLPFVIFEAPLGRLFDAIHAEADTILIGFLIMGGATLGMFFSRTPVFILWAFLLFMSRVGASFVEIGSESAFFKRVNDRDAGFISVFRTAIPLSYIVAPLLASLINALWPIDHIFIFISLIMLIGLPLSYRLNVHSRCSLPRI